MRQGFIARNIEDVRRGLVPKPLKGGVTRRLGEAQGTEFLVQQDRDTIVLRLRSHAGQATCPAVAIRLQPVEDGTRFYLTTHLASTGNRAIASATFLLAMLASISLLGIVAMNPYGWVVGLTSTSILLFIWIKALAAKSAIERSTADYLATVMTSLQTELIESKSAEPSKAPGTSLTYSDTPPVLEVNLPTLQNMPDEEISSSVIRLNQPHRTVRDSLCYMAQSHKISLPGWFGLTSQPEFALRFNADTFQITRIRPTNSKFFRNLLHLVRLDQLPIHWLNLDFAPSLAVKLVPVGAKTEARVIVKTSLLRKVWIIALFTVILPVGIFGLALGPFILLLAMGNGNVANTILGLLLTAGVGGALWTVADMDSSDRTEYLLLMEQLTNILEDVTGTDAPLVTSEGEANFPVETAAPLILHKKFPIV